MSETTKTLTEKLNGQEKSVTEKISGCQKTLTDKISAQEKCVKEVTDKIGENAMKQNRYKSEIIQKPICCSEKLDSSSKADSSSSSKLVTLTKAIDSIQENSKSLENMGRTLKSPKHSSKHFLFSVKGMKTEFATPKDLEKLR